MIFGRMCDLCPSLRAACCAQFCTTTTCSKCFDSNSRVETTPYIAVNVPAPLPKKSTVLSLLEVDEIWPDKKCGCSNGTSVPASLLTRVESLAAFGGVILHLKRARSISTNGRYSSFFRRLLVPVPPEISLNNLGGGQRVARLQLVIFIFILWLFLVRVLSRRA